MATPEQNALLALQLFGAPAAQFNQQNDARTNLAFKIATMQREEQLKIATMQREEQLKRDLADEQAKREHARNRTTLDWHRTQGENQLKIAEGRDRTAESRATASQTAKDKADILNEIDRLYPQYSTAAKRSGVPVKPRTDYPETRAGIGQLAADLSDAAITYDEKKQKGAALALVGGLDEAVTAADALRSRISELAKPLPQELKVARAQAVTALEAAIEQKKLASTEKLRPAAIKKGLAHLAVGEDALARELLGAEAITAFENQIESVLLGLDSRKSAMQERSQLNQQFLQLQSHVSREKAEVTKAAGGNPFVADELVKRRTPLQQMMTPIEEPKRQRTFGEITPAKGTPAAAGSAVIPPPPPPPSPNSDQAITRLQELGLFQRPIVQQGRASVFAPTTPDMIESARGRLTDEINRAQASGARGTGSRIQLLQQLLSNLESEFPIVAPEEDVTYEIRHLQQLLPGSQYTMEDVRPAEFGWRPADFDPDNRLRYGAPIPPRVPRFSDSGFTRMPLR